MAKASAIQIQHNETVQSIEDHLKRVERKLDKVLNGEGKAIVEAVEGTLEEIPGWAIGDEELKDLMTTVETLCNRAGVPFETLDLANEEADPIAHIKTRLTMVSDRFSPAIAGAAAAPVDTPTPITPPDTQQEAGRVGRDPDKPADKPKNR